MGHQSCWDRTVPMLSEDALMLAESNHRTANELAAAIAALRLVGSVKQSSTRWMLLGKAIARLEAFGAVHSQLSIRPPGAMDVGFELDRLCNALASARDCPQGSVLDLRTPRAVVDGATGRRLLMIASELVSNALRYAIGDRGGRIEVALHVDDLDVVLTVSDDGPGIDPTAPARGTGLGTPLVAELVRRGNGRITTESDGDGTSVEVTLPFDPLVLERARAA